MNETTTLPAALALDERVTNDELIAAQRTALRQECYAFQLNQIVEHKFFGRGKIIGMRYDNGELLWAVQFEKVSARIPTRALQALPKENAQ